MDVEIQTGKRDVILKRHKGPAFTDLDGPISPGLLWACMLVMLLGYAVGQIVVYIYDADAYFLAATGREMVEAGGFLRENPWTIVKGQDIVVQQWLYCILFYFVEKTGYVGITVFVLLQNALVAWVAWLLFRMDGVRRNLFFPALAVALVLSTRYQFSDRPECMTVLLVLMECYGLERAGRTGKTGWLWLLPLSMLLEINLHGSMWPIHYAVLLAYLVPDFLLKKTDGEAGAGLRRRWKPMCSYVVLSLLALFVNPYGWKGITYVFDAFRAGTFQALAIQEQAPMRFVDFIFLSVAVLAAGCLVCVVRWGKDRLLRTQSLYLSLGFAVMSAYAIKNAMFLVIALLYVFRDLCRGIDGEPDLRNLLSQKITARTAPLLVLFTVLFVLFPASRVQARFVAPAGVSMESDLRQVSDYIEARGGKDSRVFTGFNVGNYFEYLGYHNIYMDARPELHLKAFNGVRDELFEYVEYCMDGYMGGEGNVEGRAERIGPWFDGYGFDYVVVHPTSERLLSGYMLNKEGYRRVDSLKTTAVLLYEKEAA